jgi:hypothetical protein
MLVCYNYDRPLSYKLKMTSLRGCNSILESIVHLDS